jgi:hypothetical protein
MKNKKGFVIPLIIAIIVILIIGGGYYYTQKQSTCWPYCKNMTDQDRESIKKSAIDAGATTTLVGGDRDIHGCIGSAGYSWCEIKNKCLRVWEEKCEINSIATTTLFNVIGTIKKDIGVDYNPNGCGYCFTSDDGVYNCVLMTGKAFTLGGDLTAKNLDNYLDKKVVISTKEYIGASTMMCPISLDVDKIDLK